MTASAPAPLATLSGDRGRNEFVLDPERRHLNHGSYGAVPVRTIEYQHALKQHLEANPFRWFEELPGRHAGARASLAAFVGARADEIAMVPSASAAASVVFANVPLGPGDEVLVTDHVYGAVAMGAARAARRSGANVRSVPIPLSVDADETLERMLSAVTTRARIVVVDHISSATARGFPVQALADALAARDVVLAIDGAHALGILPAPAIRSPHVVWFGNLHKFACAPRGAATVVAQGELAQRLFPLIDSWGAELPYPERFDLQGSIDTTGFLAAPHAVETIEAQFGWDRIRRYSAELGSWAAALVAGQLAALMNDDPMPGLGMPVPQQPLLRLPRGVAEDARSARMLKDRLAAETGCETGISSWSGRGLLRISAHAYSEPSDWEYFAERGVRVIASMRP